MISHDTDYLKKLGPFNPDKNHLYKKILDAKQNLKIDLKPQQKKNYSNMLSSNMSNQPKDSHLRLARLNEELGGLKEYLISDKSSVCAQEITIHDNSFKLDQNTADMGTQA